MILLASPDIVDYQAVQEREGQVCIHLSVKPGASLDALTEAVQASVATTVAQYHCHPATVCIEYGVLTLSAGVKRRRVQRLMHGMVQ
jgi:hypothetical protein